MSQPIHTPGPITLDKKSVIKRLWGPKGGEGLGLSGNRAHIANLADNDVPNGRLLAASYNAVDSAAKKLGVNAVELAERMADGGIAALIDAVQAAKEMSDWFMKHARQAEHAHEELKQPLHKTEGWKELADSGYNGLMASYQGQFEEALAKVRGAAS